MMQKCVEREIDTLKLSLRNCDESIFEITYVKRPSA